MQMEMENKDITVELLDEEVKTQRSTYQAFRTEEEYWRLKSRSLWLKAGDRNTSYFHKQYRARLSRNHIVEIKTMEGQVCKGFDQVKAAAEAHFRNLYNIGIQAEEGETNDFLSNIPQLVNDEENTVLCRPITTEEVIQVIWSMEADKAPGPDGFSIHFYQSCWEVIKSDLLKMIKGFMIKAKIGGGIKSTFLALIPKETNPETFARFRPISLCNASYKIIAKLLANRLKPLLKKLISSNQGGFVEGRYIMDNVIQLIKACIESLWISPLVNGRPTNFFQAQRGIRQGCPLSPFLYILMADSLSRKLAVEKSAGSLPGLKPCEVSTPLNHALFADDSLLLGGVSTRIAKAFDNVLQSYCRVTGALINESKSEIYSWNAEQQEITNISRILGFKGQAKWDNFRYLGLPISSRANKRCFWTHIISKVKSKITNWGGYWLTKGGKSILIKMQLSTLPIYQSAFLLAPKYVTDQIATLIRNFLWQGGKGNEKKLHLVKWDTVKRPIDEGGLQIRDPSFINKLLGSKLSWKIISDPSHPISIILHSKYSDKEAIRKMQIQSTTASSQVWRLCCKSSEFFKKHMYIIPRNGKSTKLWKDRIMGKDLLVEREDITELRNWLERAGVNRVYDLASWDERGEWLKWDFHGVPERLKDQQIQLENLLEDATPDNRLKKDRWGWGKSGIYTSAEGYKSLQGKRISHHTPAFWKQIWEPLALPKINFFFWTLVHNKLLTGDNLTKRKFEGPHRCALCRCQLETAQHLFLDCAFTKKVWGLLLDEFQTSLPQQTSVSELFATWCASYPKGIFPKSFWRRIWIVLPKFVCWQLWLTRNQQIFKETQYSPHQVAAKAKALLLEAAQQQYIKEDPLLRPEEKRWLAIDLLSQKYRTSPLKENLEWRKRETDDIFQSWWRAQNVTTIFFDGASKGNPGVAGAGRVIYFAEGLSSVSFAWGLGEKTNNQAEILGLLKACHIAREKSAKDIQVFRDSEILIKKLIREEYFNNVGLNKILDRLKTVLQSFDSCKFYHILRNSNKEADRMANLGNTLNKGILNVNGEILYHHL
eukprot:PITA_05179